MKAYLETEPDIFVPWHGQRINGILYPSNITLLWDSSRLEALGLYVLQDIAPSGSILNKTVKRVDGIVKYVHETLSKDLSEKDYSKAVQEHLDSTAQSKGYDSISAAISYKDSTVSEWASEAMSFLIWRDMVWEYVYTELDSLKDKEKSTLEVFLENLPKFTSI